MWREGSGGVRRLEAPGNYWGRGAARAGPCEGEKGDLPHPRCAMVPRGEPSRIRFLLPSGKPAAALEQEGGQRPNLASFSSGACQALEAVQSLRLSCHPPRIPGKRCSLAPKPIRPGPFSRRFDCHPSFSLQRQLKGTGYLGTTGCSRFCLVPTATIPGPLSQLVPHELVISPLSIQVSPVPQDSDRSFPWVTRRGPLSSSATSRSSYPCAVQLVSAARWQPGRRWSPRPLWSIPERCRVGPAVYQIQLDFNGINPNCRV